MTRTTTGVSRDPGFALARGAALFFGGFSLVNALASSHGARSTQDVWWIDLSFLPVPLAMALGLIGAMALLWWGVSPLPGRRRALATAAVSLGFAVAACVNARGFYTAWSAGSISPWSPVPASLLVAAAFVWLARRVWRGTADGVPSGNGLATVVAVLLVSMIFPLLQIAFFGTTDYRRPADVAVVFGAKAYASGMLSTSLEDRVRTAADLYRAGLVTRLVMSGGVGETGADEATSMRDRATQLGVPADAITLDQAGVNTDATVENTMRLLAGGSGTRVLTVSQFYHLPRIKMAYRAAGLDVQTVPATTSRYIVETPLLVAREIPAFWKYWFRGVLGGA